MDNKKIKTGIMIILTSISPNHTISDAQSNAVNSWMEHCDSIYSFNSKEEIELLETNYPKVKFIQTNRTFEHHFGRKHVSVNALLDWAKEQPENTFLLINSDIIIKSTRELIASYIEKAKSGIVIAQRNDFDKEDMSESKRYLLGIDAFFINSKFLNIYPQSIYSLGQTYWDYWIPYRAIQNNIPVYKVKEDFIFHKRHAVQYQAEHWLKMGKYMRLENNLHDRFGETQQQLGKMSGFIHQTIMNKAI